MDWKEKLNQLNEIELKNYSKGYIDGYSEGYNAALEKIQKEVKLAIRSKPMDYNNIIVKW